MVTEYEARGLGYPSPAQAGPSSSPQLLSDDSSSPLDAAITILGITLLRTSKSAQLPSAKSSSHTACLMQTPSQAKAAMGSYCRD